MCAHMLLNTLTCQFLELTPCGSSNVGTVSEKRANTSNTWSDSSRRALPRPRPPHSSSRELSKNAPALYLVAFQKPFVSGGRLWLFEALNEARQAARDCGVSEAAPWAASMQQFGVY